MGRGEEGEAENKISEYEGSIWACKIKSVFIFQTKVHVGFLNIFIYMYDNLSNLTNLTNLIPQ